MTYHGKRMRKGNFMSLKLTHYTDAYMQDRFWFKRKSDAEVEVTAETETTGKNNRKRDLFPVSTEDLKQSNCVTGIKITGLGAQKVVDHVNTKIRKCCWDDRLRAGKVRPCDGGNWLKPIICGNLGKRNFWVSLARAKRLRRLLIYAVIPLILEEINAKTLWFQWWTINGGVHAKIEYGWFSGVYDHAE